MSFFLPVDTILLVTVQKGELACLEFYHSSQQMHQVGRRKIHCPKMSSSTSWSCTLSFSQKNPPLSDITWMPTTRTKTRKIVQESPTHGRASINCNHKEAAARLNRQYFSETPKLDLTFFQPSFSLSRANFQTLYKAYIAHDHYFVQTTNFGVEKGIS